MMTYTNQDEDEGADFERKKAIWILKEIRKYIRALAQTKGMEKSRVWNVLKKKETIGNISNQQQPDQLRKQQQLMTD